jgi:hypothetical protein
MRYLMMIKVGSGMAPVNDELMADIEKFVEKLKRNGSLVDTGGLQARESGTMMGLSHGRVTVTDGPFTEANEVVGGFIIVEVKDKSEAIGIAREFLEMHARAMGTGYAAEVEVRQMFSPDPSGPPQA